MKLDPLGEAIRIFMEIKQEVGPNEELGSELRTRARQIPELIEELGLIPALSFCFAKAKENKSYELYVKAMLRYLKDLQVITKDPNDAFSNPDGILNEIHPKSTIIVQLLRPFLIEFKRLCEATWRARSG